MLSTKRMRLQIVSYKDRVDFTDYITLFWDLKQILDIIIMKLLQTYRYANQSRRSICQA